MSRKPRDGRRARLLSKRWRRDPRRGRTLHRAVEEGSWNSRRESEEISEQPMQSEGGHSAYPWVDWERGRETASRTEYLTGDIERGNNTVTDVISILFSNGASFNHSPSYTTSPFRSKWAHPSHTAYHSIHLPPNDCLLQFSTILEHFRSRVQ